MGVINPENDNYFKSAAPIFAKVKRDLASFATVNLIDEGEFPTYVKEILRMLGLSVYKEQEAIMEVRNYKAQMPDDFTQLYAAYKCSPYINTADVIHQQGAPISVYNDVTWELLQGGVNSEIEVVEDANKIIERISVRQYVKEKAVNVGFGNPILLRLSPNVKRDRCAEDCVNQMSSSVFEISITDGWLYTNFNEDSVYMKYYAFPKDEDGMPMVLDNERLEKCLEWYIKYQVLLTMWMNNATPDLERRWMKAEQEYGFWFSEIKHERKMPTFARMINNIRRNRAVNKIAIFAK